MTHALLRAVRSRYPEWTHLLDGDGAFDDSPNLPDIDFVDLQPSFQFSGPVIKDRLWDRLSHEFIDRENPIPTSRGVFVQGVEQGIHSDQLTWQVSPRNKLAFQFSSDPKDAFNLGLSSTTGAESS